MEKKPCLHKRKASFDCKEALFEIRIRQQGRKGTDKQKNEHTNNIQHEIHRNNTSALRITRFPGKPLALLGGEYVIKHVYDVVASTLGEAYVATDDQRIYDAVVGFGGKAVMTRADHKSGTDRIEEAVSKIGTDCDVVVNIQGDEPFIHPSQIKAVCDCFNDPSTQIATLGKPFTDMESVENPNSPKIVVNNSNNAMYFSRSVIPFIRGVERSQWIDRFPF